MGWEDQERDEQGRWGSGGGAGTSMRTEGERPRGAHGFADNRVSPREFIELRDRSARLGFMSPLSETDLVGSTLVTSRDGKVGYVLTADGDLGNLFNNGGPKGAGRDALIDGIQRGAKTLDAFDGFLPDLYHDYGFVETGRVRFDDRYAPPGWDYDKYGRPDVVFMAYKGGDRGTIGERVGSFGRSRRAPYTDGGYEAAKEHSRRVAESAGGAERGGVGPGELGPLGGPAGVHRVPVSDVRKATG